MSFSPDKQSVYITLNIKEGDTFEINKINLVGDLPVDEEILRSLILIEEGSTYSQF